MQRRTFLSSILGGVAGGLRLARGGAPEQTPSRPQEAALSAQTSGWWTPLLKLTLADGREVYLDNVVARRTYQGSRRE